jgi:hypothetical protein
MATKSETERELSKTQNKLLWESNRRKNTLEAISNLRSWAVFSEIPGDLRTQLVSKIDEIINRS